MRRGWRYEKRLAQKGFVRIAGVDEAGRGPLAGPVVAAAVILPVNFRARGIDDSKVLTPRERERLYSRITNHAECGVGVASVDEIDRLNILRASHLAMRRALQALPPPAPDHALIDGRFTPDRFGLDVGEAEASNRFTALIDGDAQSVSIAAASIIAKVTRDRQMEDLDAQFPGYGFAQHKGYYTPDHIAALRELGPCAIHRQSFAPVRDWRNARASGQLELELFE